MPYQSPEFVELFAAYTAGPDSIGAHLAEVTMRDSSGDPLLVVTGTDIALYPGDGSAPTVEPYRLSTRGFKELAAVSHLGPALASLARLRDVDPHGLWRPDAEALLAALKSTRAANSVGLWRDRIAVDAFAGRETAIAAMIDYSCRVAERMLTTALDEPERLTATDVRETLLEGRTNDVAFNRVMIATFFLTGMDIAHRLISWFDALDLGWERAMVVIAGRAGRPTAGVTEESNSVAGIIRAAARGRLGRDRLYIAPHAPTFPQFDGDVDSVAHLESEYRRLWASLHATSQLGEAMFAGHPRFEPRTPDQVRIDSTTTRVYEKPDIAAPDDWFAMTTRLRVVMEDPRQLLSGAVTDYAARQLVDHDNDPAAVTVPGLDGELYPPLNEESRND
jgi:hypothetical protein